MKKNMDEILLAAESGAQGKKQRRLFKKKRSGEVLTREQVKAIKLGRQKLRKELRAQGIKSRQEFELTASALGLYFDKNRFWGLLLWFFHGRGLWALLGAAALLMASLFLFSTITQIRGHFTINMSDGMFREGFVLSETVGFENPTTHLFCTPAEDVPCISISHLPNDLDEHDGQHNASYFAYTFYVRNEGESTVGYDWSINLNSESKKLSKAVWVMVFEDGEMSFYAKANENGEVEALPPFGDNSRGYIEKPLEQFAKSPQTQYEVIAQRSGYEYSRVIPISFESDDIICRGKQEDVYPMDVHKYTVVIWLEGDDPDCTDEMIGGHIGMEFYMRLNSEESETASANSSWKSSWDKLWENLKFWEG